LHADSQEVLWQVQHGPRYWRRLPLDDEQADEAPALPH